jgi:5-formyltetrahydrofolate cyclo-ligase
MSSPAPTTIATKKSQMRGETLRARAGLDATTRESEVFACHQALFALPAFQTAHTILCTLSFGDEMTTRAVIDHALSLGKRVALPRVNVATKQLELFFFDATTMLEKSKHGIEEPALTSSPAALGDIALILVPGLAFDSKGYRLGYGRGFYDKLLSKTVATRVALAFSCQIVECVPTESHDATIDTLITATKTQHFLSSKVKA